MSVLSTVCTTCSASFNNSDDVYSTSCGHLYHFACLTDWQRRGTSCPKCQYYNPSTHKLYFSFDDSETNAEKQEEMESKLKESNEKLTQLLVQMSESETNFLQLQKQFTGIEKGKRDVEERIRQINDSEENVVQLQRQYRESSKIVKELEDRLNQLLIENATKDKELRLKKLENESLKASLDAEQDSISDGILNERVNILEKKLQLLSEEYEKEIITSTQLSLEKMELQSQLEHINSLNKITKTIPKQNKKESNPIHKNGNAADSKNCSNKKNDATSSSVFIKDLPLDQIVIPLQNVVINLALKMDLSLSADDLVKANFVENDDLGPCKAQLLAQFKSKNLRDKFFSKRNALKNYEATKSIVISEVVDEQLNELLRYANQKLGSKGFKNIYCRNNKVFASKSWRNKPLEIRNKSQVDSLIMNVPQEKNNPSEQPTNKNTTDENLYQI